MFYICYDFYDFLFFVHVYIYVFICIFMYICIYTHIYIYIYIYILVWTRAYPCTEQSGAEFSATEFCGTAPSDFEQWLRVVTSIYIYIYTSLTPFPNPVMAIYVHALCVAICDSSCNAIIEDANDTRLQVQATQCWLLGKRRRQRVSRQSFDTHSFFTKGVREAWGLASSTRSFGIRWNPIVQRARQAG